VRLAEYYWVGDDIEENEMGGFVSVNGEKRNASKVLGKELEGKVQFGRPGHRWEDNRKIYVDVR